MVSTNWGWQSLRHDIITLCTGFMCNQMWNNWKKEERIFMHTDDHSSHWAYLICGGLAGKPHTRSLRHRGNESAVRSSCPSWTSDLRLHAVIEKHDWAELSFSELLMHSGWLEFTRKRCKEVGAIFFFFPGHWGWADYRVRKSINTFLCSNLFDCPIVGLNTFDG